MRSPETGSLVDHVLVGAASMEPNGRRWRSALRSVATTSVVLEAVVVLAGPTVSRI